MQEAVSVSLGSRKRDKEVQVTLLGQTVRLRREGWDGDVRKVAQRFAELDGRVDALGVGGIDLWIGTDQKRYPLHAAHRLVRAVRQTPLVDGSGLKHTLERQVAPALIAAFGETVRRRRVLVTSAADRFGMAASFYAHNQEIIFGDLGFALGLPIPIRTLSGLKRLLTLLAPLVGRLPISLLYPMGEKQEKIIPKFASWYAWADIIAGDCNYVKRHMPADLGGKFIVTNTTTERDRQLFAERGVTHVLTTTPILDGRSFGTNVLEAALTAAAGKKRPLTHTELGAIIRELNLKPTLHAL